MKIKAYAVKKKGGKAEPFFYERTLGKNDVLVSITHCSITRGDIQLINNDWGDTTFPLVPGHEIIGIIEETSLEVSDLKHGDRVGIGYQQEACFECEFCREGNEQFCPKQKVIAVDCYGGLAQHIVVDSRFVFKLPPELDSANSAPLMSSGLTVYSAIVRAKLPNDSTVGVLGIGGLGSLALQFFHKMGHKVSAFSHSPTKKTIAEEFGAGFVDSSKPMDLSRHNRKYDFIISTLNADFDLDTYLKMLKPQGKFCLVAQPLNKLAMSAGLLYDYAQRTIYGNYTGSRKDMVDMLDFSAKQNIQSVIEVMPFSEMNEALDMVRVGKGPLRLVLENRK
jgi:D-arabinose 1-dehydrogenase-like Zn-dependent alcohol dehydrogenase